jgi:hypothetical protein
MGKKKTLKLSRYIKGYVIWLIIGVFVASTYNFVIAYRNNDIEMVGLREAVYVADEQGGDIETALRELRDFVTTHMNADLRKGSNTIESEDPIQLVNTYNRAVAAEQVRVSTERAKIASEAQSSCEKQFPLPPLTRRAQCVQEYKDARTVTERTIDKQYYTYDFVSPSWSPDEAGLSLLVSVTTGLALAATILVGFVREELE